jgi:hypothetical protein
MDSRGDAHGYGDGVALPDLASSVELLRRYVAWENWYVTSVEGDSRQRKLAGGTELVKWPFLLGLLARRLVFNGFRLLSTEVILIVSETLKIANCIRRELPAVKHGTLRFWGNWFGRPYDVLHAITSCEASGEILKLRFDHEELLSVWSPRDLKLDEATFQIGDAERVLWEWNYGRPKPSKGLHFKDFTKAEGKIVVETNIDWFTPDMNTDSTLPAVEILRISSKVRNTPPMR